MFASALINPLNPTVPLIETRNSGDIVMTMGVYRQCHDASNGNTTWEVRYNGQWYVVFTDTAANDIADAAAGKLTLSTIA